MKHILLGRHKGIHLPKLKHFPHPIAHSGIKHLTHSMNGLGIKQHKKVHHIKPLKFKM